MNITFVYVRFRIPKITFAVYVYNEKIVFGDSSGLPNRILPDWQKEDPYRIVKNMTLSDLTKLGPYRIGKTGPFRIGTVRD